MPLDRATFANPPQEFAGAPFWSWNDLLREEELVRQIREMKARGWGGFFMHARVGLETPYMSREWMQKIRACVFAARELGMFAWLYDEDKWPSGFASGVVPRLGAEYRSKVLVCRVDGDAVAEFDCKYDAEGMRELRRVPLPEPPKPPEPEFGVSIGEGRLSFPVPEVGREEPLAAFEDGRTRLDFAVHTAPLGNPRFNGTSYVDLLNPKVTDAFIESTHEAYLREVGTAFGFSVPGMFTDEPTYSMGHWGSGFTRFVPWTGELPAVFQEQNGYDLLEHLPSLFFDVGDYHRVRFHFWSTVTDLFVRSYTRRVFDWCERNRLKLTGHFLHEDNLQVQVENIGAAMPHYEYMQQPGIDFLCRHVGYIGEGMATGPRHHVAGVLTAKQCTSVAHQLGKPRVLSELYGCSGQNMSFEDRKWIGDWHLVHGVNFLNQHLSLYSMRGERKRDYPPNIFYQQPWWPYTRPLEDYQRRLCYVLTQGERQTDVLVLHPIGSAWSLYRPGEAGKVRELQEHLVNVSVWLLQAHQDFDYGDEKILSKYGAIGDGGLRIGHQTYDTVIIPPSVSWQRSTLQFLKKFRDDGGQILAVEPLPTMVEGERSEELIRWLRRVPRTAAVKDTFTKDLSALRRPPFRLQDVQGENLDYVWHHWRRLEDGRDVLFLANVHKQKEWEGTLSFPRPGVWEVWDPVAGRVEPAYATVKGNTSTIEVSFAPAGSALLVRRDGKPKRRGIKRRKHRPIKEVPLSNGWKVADRDPNCYLLDYCVYMVDEEEQVWSEEVPVFLAQQYFSQRGGKAPYRIAYFVEVDFTPSARQEFTLAMEIPAGAEITVNDKPVSPLPGEYWRDIGWSKIDLTGRLKKGMNYIEVAGRWRPETRLEAAYLLGDFSVHHENRTLFWLERPRRGTVDGDMVDAGYPFFVGEMVLSQEVSLGSTRGRLVTLDFDQLGAIVAMVKVNGKKVGQLFWRPFSLDVTEHVKRGRNRIEIKLVTSLFNLLGPHHHKDGELYGVSPGSFTDLNSWVDRYFLVRLAPENARITVRQAKR